ncbi:MAG: hypothetical protein A2539_02450 [Elusimicrobia bacterium RIFOXYD2_FULL_34_15]|nr:MAG: hypothetical protein A2539_02450 [Elusimicrobia bacterium RIFOXYD2_FULL_34_15]
MNNRKSKHVLVLINQKAGMPTAFDLIRRALDRYWDVNGIDLSYQFCQSQSDCKSKAERAVKQDFDTVLVVGGDGTVNTVGQALIGTDISLGVIPSGSGNGFARHFGIPLRPEKAIRVLSSAEVKYIDVGLVNEKPFFVTCSMAWDASFVKSFQKKRIRGVIPYVFAGVQGLFEYHPQEIVVKLDSGKKFIFSDVLLFTIANLTQYGAGAKIAPDALADDGFLELVVAMRQDIPKLIANVGRLFNGSIKKIPEIIFKRFKLLTVNRPQAGFIQIDGELVNVPAEVKVQVLPKALKVLVPNESRNEYMVKIF